jgi:hypothetical protein
VTAFHYQKDALLIQHLADIGVPFRVVATFLRAFSAGSGSLNQDREVSSDRFEQASVYLLSARYNALSIDRIANDHTGLNSSVDLLRFIRGVFTQFELSKHSYNESILAYGLLTTIQECGPQNSCSIARAEISRCFQFVCRVQCLKPVEGGVSGLSLYTQLEIVFDFINRVISNYPENELTKADKLAILITHENPQIDQTCRQIINRYLTANAQVPFFTQWLEFIESLSAVASHHICGQEDASLLCSFLVSKSSVMESSSFPAEYLKYSTIALAVLESVTHFYSDPE